MDNIRSFSQKELDLIKAHQSFENSLFRKYGLEIMMMGILVMLLLGLFLHENQLNIFFGYGPAIGFATIFYMLFKNFYSLYKIIHLENLFIEAMAKRTGFDIVSLSTLGDEYPFPQLLDKENYTYYNISLSNGGVRIHSSKSL